MIYFALECTVTYVFYLDFSMYGNKVNFKPYYIILDLAYCVMKKNSIFIYWVIFLLIPKRLHVDFYQNEPHFMPSNAYDENQYKAIFISHLKN